MQKLSLEFEQGCLNIVSCESQQSFRKSQVLQKCAHGQTECHGQKGPSVMCFGSVNNHLPKEFHFYEKLVFPLPLAKSLGSWLEITGRWTEAKQSLKMCQCVSCTSASLDGEGQTCFLFAFFSFLFPIDLKNAALKPHF